MGDTYVPISYGPIRLAVILGAARLVGWPLLALGAWRSKVTGVAGAAVLAAFGFHRQGVLKGSSTLWTVIVAALCVVLVPLGVKMLRDTGTAAGESR